MDASITTLFESGFYRILDFRCRCTDCVTSKPEYSKSFCISFVRTGNFLFNVFRNSMDSYTGCVIVTKPGYEHTVTHTHPVPDECTIIEFRNEFYQDLLEQYGNLQFLKSNDLHSTLINTKTETEFLHFQIIRLVLGKKSGKLEIDSLVIELVEKVLMNISEYKPGQRIASRLKKNHLQTIERAKEFIRENFIQDISLAEIANYCHVSPFHFSRLFKTFTSYSPHQFLLNIRLHHAEMLLKNSNLPIADIGFSSGFNSVEHFTTAFRLQYKTAPTKFRMEKAIQ